MADIKFVVEVDTKTGTAELKALDTAVESLGKTTEKAGSKWVDTMKGFISAQAIIGAARKVWRELTDVVGDSIKAANEAESADSALRAALWSTGREVDVLSGHFIKYAKELQKQTVYDDEAIKGAQALLLQLADLDSKGIDRATRGSIGLATVWKMDLETAAGLVGKALAGNIGLLGRYGIHVADNLSLDQQTASALTQLEVLYGRSTKEVETTAGQQKILKVNLSEVLETMGNSITKSEGYQKGLKDLNKIVRELSENEDFKLWLNTVAEGLTKAAAAATKFTGGAVGIYQKFVEWALGADHLAESQRKLDAAHSHGGVAAAAYGRVMKQMADGIERAKKEEAAAIIVADAHGNTLTRQAAAVGTAITSAMTVRANMIKTTHGAVVSEKELEAQLKKTAKATDDVKRETVELGSAYGPLADAVARYGGMALEVVGQVDAVSQQAYTNATVRIDNEYNRRKQAIINSLMNEKDKAAALEVLEAEFEVKRREAMRGAAAANKAVAMMGAIVNTAMAVTRALAAAPPPWNIALAAISAALGAAQIALIAAEPVPFKKGLGAGPIDKPTFAILGEGGEREWVVTDRQLRQVVNNNNYGPRRQQIALKVMVGGDEFDAKVIEVVQRADRGGKLKLKKAYA